MKRRYQIISSVFVLVFFAAAAIFTGCEVQLEQRDCVVMLGDSIFDYSDEETASLQELSGHQYRTYYQNGAQMDGGMIPDIEDQYDDAVRDGYIRTIIMDGGGNDFLMGIGDIDAINEEIREAFIRILDKAQRDGVENVIVQGYYLTASSPDGYAEEAAEMGAALESAGADRGISLVYVNPVEDSWFSSRRPSQYTIIDGIHPTEAASERLAQLVWDAMVTNNIEQGEGCPTDPGGCE